MFSFSFVKKNVAAETSLQPVIGNKDFDCHKENSEAKSSSVHKLTPSDIDVVATLGDSIMVGLGARAKSLSHFLTEYRGISWRYSTIRLSPWQNNLKLNNKFN